MKVYPFAANEECGFCLPPDLKRSTVTLLDEDGNVIDESAGLRGYYGRLLAHIYYNGDDFTAELVKKGYARVYVEGNCKKKQEYLQYQQQVMSAGAGLWGTCRSADCDPAYPDICIPPPSPDPHGLDGDHDGVGCKG